MVLLKENKQGTLEPIHNIDFGTVKIGKIQTEHLVIKRGNASYLEFSVFFQGKDVNAFGVIHTNQQSGSTKKEILTISFQPTSAQTQFSASLHLHYQVGLGDKKQEGEIVIPVKGQADISSNENSPEKPEKIELTFDELMMLYACIMDPSPRTGCHLSERHNKYLQQLKQSEKYQ